MNNLSMTQFRFNIEIEIFSNRLISDKNQFFSHNFIYVSSNYQESVDVLKFYIRAC